MVTSQHEGLTKVATFDVDYTRHMLLALFDLPIPKSGEGRLASPDLSEADPAVCRDRESLDTWVLRAITVDTAGALFE
ncbi:hypothetical protein MF672_047955 [Actinomadura sp. ATCC 31491]|uniref:Uncharacterized protein n=1 Tax=Actinomadura luzonensis TaxID=2805427 RepID=A0ABT0GAI5_9ACTN|nr:hypothetical protein [Actinomadura luzonensis]MCK2221489.1 hypothetical protein [Actinomadura luzonensis]